MDLLLLAASHGDKRLGDIVDGIPKCLVPIPNGNTVIGQNIDNALPYVDHVFIVTGYRSDLVHGEASKHTLRGSIIYNPAWNVAKNGMSLWVAFATHRMSPMNNSGLIVCNGDTILGSDTWKRASESPEGFVSIIKHGGSFLGAEVFAGEFLAQKYGRYLDEMSLKDDFMQKRHHRLLYDFCNRDGVKWCVIDVPKSEYDELDTKQNYADMKEKYA